ncbi:hypothetical protein [Deinococcus misasensis]|uniref:hypothetical protein n=1 Tax=Deinococcus misasensis TaxID=392413 RepID=UPI0012F7728C|nr:hypothetical protein [Deinococcus misasensis]
MHKDSLLMLLLMGVNALNYGFTVLLGRFLQPTEYGQYVGFMALLLILSLLPATLQQTAARFAALSQSVTRNLWMGTRKHLLWLVLVGVAVLVWLAPVLELPVLWLVLLMLALPVYTLVGLQRGEAQGQHDTRSFTLSLYIEHGVKILFTLPLFLVLPKATAAVVATLLPIFLVALQLRKHLPKQVSSIASKELKGYLSPTFTQLATQALFMNLDVLLAPVFLSHEDAGLYAAVSVVGKVIFYVLWAMTTALFPRVASGEKSRELLKISLALGFTITLGAVLVCFLAGPQLVHLLFGSAYSQASSLIGWYALATSLYGMAFVIANHYLALGSKQAGYLMLPGLVLQVVGLLFFHADLQQMLLALIFSRLVLLIGYLALLVSRERNVAHVVL